MAVVVYCNKCFTDSGSCRVHTEMKGILQSDSECDVYLYQNVESITGGQFIPNISRVREEVCNDIQRHGSVDALRLAGEQIFGTREQVRRSAQRAIEDGGVVEDKISL